MARENATKWHSLLLAVVALREEAFGFTIKMFYVKTVVVGHARSASLSALAR